MKRITSGILLAICLGSGLGMFSTLPQKSAIAQTQNDGDLFYIYQGQRIPLNQRQDAIAVSFKKTRTRDVNAPPLYLQLQQDLQIGIRFTTPPKVSPLGENYAVVNLPTGTSEALQQRIQQQPYVQTTLPVLSRSQSQEVIVLPNEIIISFDSQLSESQREAILQKNNLAIVRKLRFSRDRYLVKSTSAEGTKILSVANQLNGVKGVSSAAPNFIQSVTNQNLETVSKQVANLKDIGDWPQTTGDEGNPQIATASTRAITPNSSLLGWAWHLNSLPLKQCLQNQPSDWQELQNCLKQPPTESKTAVARTDIRVTEAWKHSNGGRGIVVAVLDSLIEWDHPDLANNLYKVTAADKCPKEVYGWDFSAGGDSSDPCEIGDADTRISPTELAILGAKFQDTFQLSDAKLVQQYPQEAQQIQRAYPNYTLEQIANVIRYIIRTYKVGGEFHGTWVSGVIAANSKNPQGLIGVAPNAKILPVRVFGLNGSISTSAYIEAIGYAAARGADVINLSLGASLPNEQEQEAIADVLKANPKLVIVASAGNNNNNQVAYPAGYKGVVAVGATNLAGNRAPYSNYGKGLDVVAPGGDLNTPGLIGGIPTTGGTWLDAFWQGVPNPTARWSNVLDPRGKYWWVQGTSFSSPAVAGVVALMKGENPNLNRNRLISILKSTASYQGLKVGNDNTASSAAAQQQYLFGKGLVNADAAVQAVKKGR